MSVSEAPWDGAASNYADTAAYCNACLINDNTGPSSGWTQDKCHLPYKTPSGAISRNGCHAAAGRINQMKGVSSASKASARRKLASVYRNDLKEDPPAVLTGG